MSEFSDRPLIAGSILGLRSFRVTDDGVLTGVMHQQCRFGPGVNEAICLNVLSRYVSAAMARIMRKKFGWPDPVERPHQAAEKGCTCGFYAYFDGSNDYALYWRLERMFHSAPAGFTGIIEGTGLVTVGSRGFRAEKARLVALVVPDADVQVKRPWGAMIFTLIALFDLATGMLDLLKGDMPMAGVGGLATAIVGAVAVLRWRHWRAETKAARAKASLYAKVRANYPDAAIYTTEEAALEAHPLTPPPAAEQAS